MPAAALALGVVVPASALGAAAATELVKNGTFDTSTTNWWSLANTPISVDAGQLKAVVPGGTAERWDAMLGQNVPAFPIHQGHRYVLSFDARATATRQLRTTVQHNTAPYPSTLDRLFTVGTTKQRFALGFTGSLETAQAELTFQLGDHPTGYSVWFDNVSLVDTYGTVAGSPISLTNGFYVDPKSNPKIWVDNNPGTKATAINAAIATKPMARWFGNWNTNIADAVQQFVGPADAADKVPTLVAYNIPGRDACGGHSGGGAGTEAAYKDWVQTFAAAIGSRPALVILEPDSLGDFQCMTPEKQDERVRMLQFALQQFKDFAPNTWVYLDAGNKGWGTASDMAQRLTRVGVGNAHGFSLNVSNYYTTAETIPFADAINDGLAADKPFVIDTSRNGAGAGTTWCNPPGRKLGVTARVGGGAELLLWVKVPGNSDGVCNESSLPAGQFDPDLAIKLIP
ncbi:endoglucanase [Kribbella turkmenica]|uniref:Glucanase n=1 Tax=Kribbella turkmenica TaxID=2530375 RepID=A0A4R4W7H0_9ACTN|nr:endoglucanase [Kribbella turkmenica]